MDYSSICRNSMIPIDRGGGGGYPKARPQAKSFRFGKLCSNFISPRDSTTKDKPQQGPSTPLSVPVGMESSRRDDNSFLFSDAELGADASTPLPLAFRAATV